MAQEDSPFNFSGPKVTADFVLSEIISYPKEAARARKEGRVVYQVKIDSSGNLVSSKLVEETHPVFKEEAQKAMKYLEESWYPELLGLKAPGENYLVVMTFANLNLQVDPADRLAQASRLIEKGKVEKAISILTRLIEDYPFGKEYYETRAKAFARIRKNEEFKKDTQQIINLEKTVLIDLTTFMYSTRSKVPISF
jgi:TonB family protein